MSTVLDNQAQDVVSGAAFRSLAAFNRLLLEAGLCENRQELVFHILNRTITYVHYDRAYLFSTTGRRPRVLGVSGTDRADMQSSPITDRRQVVHAMDLPDQPVRLEADRLSRGAGDTCRTLQAECDGTDVACIPLTANKKTVALLWLERWGGRCWHEKELKGLQSLGIGYGNALRIFRPRGGARPKHRLAKWTTTAVVLAALALVMVFVKVPLRIVAPCEVVPQDPMAVTAPIEGTIDSIAVEPMQQVGKGSLLFAYEKSVVLDELTAAEKRLSVVRARLRQVEAEALDDVGKRSELELVRRRLEEEKARLSMARYRAGRLDVTAPADGVVVLDDPNRWRGRPVGVGQRVLTLVDPSKSKLRIWLPQDDKIPINHDQPVRVLLNASTSDTVEARLAWVSNYAEGSPEGTVAFPAEAHWQVDPAEHWMGLKGTAVVYGPRVPLYAWLFRRPLAGLRQTLGW